jgi:hypothetical protein
VCVVFWIASMCCRLLLPSSKIWNLNLEQTNLRRTGVVE